MLYVNYLLVHVCKTFTKHCSVLSLNYHWPHPPHDYVRLPSMKKYINNPCSQIYTHHQMPSIGCAPTLSLCLSVCRYQSGPFLPIRFDSIRTAERSHKQQILSPDQCRQLKRCLWQHAEDRGGGAVVLAILRVCECAVCEPYSATTPQVGRHQSSRHLAIA